LKDVVLSMWWPREPREWHADLKGGFSGSIYCVPDDEKERLIDADIDPRHAHNLPEGHRFTATLMTEGTDFYESAATLEDAQRAVWERLKDVVLLWAVGLMD
jgi:hypothetical protein